MKIFLKDKQIKRGSVIYYNNVKYIVVGYDADPDKNNIILKLKVAE